MAATDEEYSKITIRVSLQPMFEKARAEGLWFYCNYQGLWFSPDALNDAQAEGRFCWGKVNWTLRNPSERLRELEQHERAAKEETDRFRALLAKGNSR